MPTTCSSCRGRDDGKLSSSPVGLHMSPKTPSPPPPPPPLSILKLDNKLPCEEGSLSWDSNTTFALGSIVSMPPDDASIPKSSAELRKEISTLEAEIVHLERHLLSLYRTAFEECVPNFSTTPSKDTPYDIGSPSLLASQSFYSSKQRIQRSLFLHHNKSSPSCGWMSWDNQSVAAGLESKSSREHKTTDTGRRSLADHIGAPSLLTNANAPDRLSEDIIRCISSIYCRLTNPLHCHLGSSSSPTYSLSSSSLFSSQNPCDNWSPLCSEDAKVHHQLQGLKEESGPYSEMVEVLKISLNDSSFNYAAAMLKQFRSLVRNLEKVDPGKMKREEKLAFWINIHNALVMHAYLAYGTDNHAKTTSFSKAAYNVGGYCINSYIIQNSIFGIQSHNSESWLQTLFSPGRKAKTGSSRHIYALEYPEPLVHFALCSGVYSDPAVRVYTAKNVFQELKLAKEEYIQSSVHIHKEAKVFLPRILAHYAEDMSMDLPGLLEVICECVTEVQRKAVRKCMKRKGDKCIQWLSQRSSFRYVIHGEVAKGR